MQKIFLSITLVIIVMAQPFAMAHGNENSSFTQVNEGNIDLLIESIENHKPGETPPELSMEECLGIALKKNRYRAVSAYAVSIAEYQHKQALSAYWPTILMNSSISRMDEDLNFIFPRETSNYGITGMTIPGEFVGQPPGSVIPLPDQNVDVTVPEKNIKVMDRNRAVGALELSMPLYTGGIRSAVSKQAELGVKVAREAARRTDLKVIYDVKRIYYGAVLAEALHNTGKNSLARLNATLELTEHLYKKGAGVVTKADYLRNKVMVETVRSMVSLLESNLYVSRAALVNTMGLSRNSHFNLSEKEIPFIPCEKDLETLVDSSYKFNPDWKRMVTALDVAEARIKEEKGGYLPKIMLTGTLWKMHSFNESGVETDENTDGWNIGLGMQIPVFDGFLTKNRVGEARARLGKLQKEQILLKEGLGLQINHIFLMMKGYQKQQAASLEAVRNAEENRKLNIRAYENELVETKDVIEAQLLEAFMEAQYHKALYSYSESIFHLDFLVGNEIKKLIGGSY